MKKSWFTHTGLTTEEANELVARYKSKEGANKFLI